MAKQEYMLKVFPLILKGIENELSFPTKCWVRSSPSDKLKAFPKLIRLTDKEKQDFVYNIVLIHGVIGTTRLSFVEYKRQGSKFHLSLSFDIPFETDEQKEEYNEFRDWVMGVNATSYLLDEAMV